MTRMWWYTIGTLILWVVNPEIRRVYEWRFGAGPIDPFPLLPLLAVVPHLWSLTYGGGWLRVPRPLIVAAWLWLGSFAYAFILAVINGHGLPGAFTFATFVLPLSIGLWMAADSTPVSKTYPFITNVCCVITTLISVYGIVQYVVAPEWDKLWLQHAIAAGSLSFGRPAPFQIRVFSMLGSPGPFGNFMALMLLIALPKLAIKRPFVLIQVPIWLVAFSLSLDRTGWLLFASGMVIYLVFAPRRTEFLVVASLGACLFAGIFALLPEITGNDAVTQNLTSRFSTLSDLDSDRSGRERRGLYDTGMSLLSDAPFGQGLGVVGTATKLSEVAATTDFDSGILSRLVEMGIPGVVMLVLTFGVLATAIIRVWKHAVKGRDTVRQTIASVAIAILVALVVMELFGDVSGLLLLTLWMASALAIGGKLYGKPCFRIAPPVQIA